MLWCLMEQEKWAEDGESKASDNRDETPLWKERFRTKETA